ncbi:three-helix bundle dimerization domain-containing protein [Streptomyces filipinensis]|uniref:three-helix bundle dimerization domain-containing protein n=1 Tax=Streptomyces filipinensis TaxID=66887 RepID=UPI0036E6A273
MIWTTQDHQLTRGGAVATDPREDEAMRGVNERLKAAHGQTHSLDEITAVVAGAYAAFRDRPVRDFIPILVERRARRILDRGFQVMATALSGADGSRRPTSPNFGMAGENLAWSSSVSGVWTTYAPAEWFAFTGKEFTDIVVAPTGQSAAVVTCWTWLVR